MDHMRGWMPHGMCFQWDPIIFWGLSITDFIIWLSYCIIPIVLIAASYGIGIKFRWMFLMFALFIVSCGTGHLIDEFLLWKPWYYAKLIVNIITAISSIGTAIAVMQAFPTLRVLARLFRTGALDRGLLAEELKRVKELP